MTHNDFDMMTDLIEPLKQFFLESNVVPSLGVGAIRKIKRKFTIPPASIRHYASKHENDQLDRMIRQLELKATRENKSKAIKLVQEASKSSEYAKTDLPSARPSKSYSQATCLSLPKIRGDFSEPPKVDGPKRMTATKQSTPKKKARNNDGLLFMLQKRMVGLVDKRIARGNSNSMFTQDRDLSAYMTKKVRPNKGIILPVRQSQRAPPKKREKREKHVQE